jgi:ADP-ribosyl-[dinitrogen reductase] hydrolase
MSSNALQTSYEAILKNLFLAGWCADAVGARLEFANKKFTANVAKNALHHKGHTTTEICKGQFTDDSEMEIALLDALVTCQNDAYFPIDKIAENYIKWCASEPFDIGQTTMTAFLGANTAEDIMENVVNYNERSESNGSLMRCIPLAVYGIGKTHDELFSIVEIEASLTHSSLIVHHITALYCYIISYMLERKIKQLPIHSDALLQIIKNTIANEKIMEWFNEATALKNLCNYNSITNCGHVKHAFIFVIYFLKHIANYTYQDALVEVLKCGGDTDTNAKIVGNLFGAYYDNCIPEYVLNPVLQFDCTAINEDSDIYNAPFKRPYIYGINHGLHLIKHIILRHL